jgi:hydroxyacylglutathione hydrolase
MSQQSAVAEAHPFLLPEVVTLDVHYRAMKNFNYLIVDPESGQAVIVDPAWELGKIERAIEEQQVTLSGILVTHSHPDHIHLATPLSEKYGCPIFMSNEEIAASRFSARNLVGIDETPWEVGEMLIEPVITPGHTPGSTCYLIGDNLFTGDVLFAEGCGMCPDTQAAYAMYASLEQLKKRTGLQTRVFPGHSYGQRPGQAMSQLYRDNLYLQFKDKDSFAAFRLRSGQHKATMFSFS